jgi:hypothetical protein
MKKGEMSDMKNFDLMIGVITSRKCPTCGHHEVGYETDDGTFFPLRPGDRIGVFPKSPVPNFGGASSEYSEPIVEDGDKYPAEFVPWVPEPLRCDRSLCRRYGVLINKGLIKEEMSPALYEMAYRQKLQWLIEKEVHTPLSIILDRFFVAPHLASGNPKQVADALWEELDEIVAPVTRVSEWLQNEDDMCLLKMIHPKTKIDLKGEMVSDNQLREELNGISLEDFFEVL